jgi:fatty acyl-CoA reductase
LALLKDQVTIVFHSAATIRFDEPLKRALDINVSGTKRVLDLSHKLRNLQALVHVSTAYCNKGKKDVKEAVYEDTISPSKIIEAAEWMDDDMLATISSHLFAGRPSSYHYTKALAENLLLKEGNGMSIAIIRPSIITAAWKEPIPGWIDNYNGTTGYLVVSGKGILRSMLVHPQEICDMIPVDIVANTCIAAAYMTASRSPRTVQVYNCTTGGLNPITWSRVKQLSEPLLIKHPSMEMFRYPGTNFWTNRYAHQLNILIEHEVPAHFVDFLFKITGHKTILAQVYQKVHRTINALEFFTTNEWTFRNNNMLSLTEDMSEPDRELLALDVRRIHWPSYMETYILGVRKFLLREDPSTLPEARRRLHRLYLIILSAKLLAATVISYQTLYPHSTFRTIYSEALILAKDTVLRLQKRFLLKL